MSRQHRGNNYQQVSLTSTKLNQMWEKSEKSRRPQSCLEYVCRQVEWGRGAAGPFHHQTRWTGCGQELFLVVHLPNNPAREVFFYSFPREGKSCDQGDVARGGRAGIGTKSV